MDPLGQDYFGESRAQLIKSLESQRRSNRLMLIATTFSLICLTGLCISLFFVPPSGSSLMGWLENLLPRCLPIAVILWAGRAQLQVFQRGQQELAAHQRGLREVEMLRVATLSALASKDHDALAGALDGSIEVNGRGDFANVKRAATSAADTVVHLSKYVPSSNGSELSRGRPLQSALAKWRTRTLQANLHGDEEGKPTSRHSEFD